MEQPNLYLTYDEYVDLGGTLDESSYTLYALDADAYIDWYTFNRLWGEETIPDKVNYCVYQLIRFIEAKMNQILPPVNENGFNATAQVTRYSNDGVTVEYNVLHADEIYHNCSKEIDGILNRYLDGLVNSAGRKLLYRGLYPGE